MKLLRTLLFGKPAKPAKPKKEKKKLLPSLLSWLLGLVLTGLELKWSEDFWKPDF